MSLLAGIGTSIASGEYAKKAQQATEKEHAQKSALLDSVFNKQYYSDITKRTDVQNLMRMMQENQDRQAKRDDAVAAITGATPEAQLASQDSRNKSYANALADIASNASTLKDTYMQNYLVQRMGLNDPSAAIWSQYSKSLGDAGDNLFKTGFNLAGKGLGDVDWFDKTSTADSSKSTEN